MGVTHVIRGDDGISNTPRQILIQEAIGAPRPVYAHLPLVLGKDKSKLSKRHGAKSILEFREEGYLPEAIINQLALLGWNPGTDEEFFTVRDLEHVFDLSGIQKGGAIFSEEKLKWFNSYHIKQLPLEEGITHLKKILPTEYQTDAPLLIRAYPTLIERLAIFSEILDMHEKGDLGFYFTAPDYDKESLKWKKAESVDAMKPHLEYIYTTLKDAPIETWTSPDELKKLIWDHAEAQGRGDVLWPYRYALTGSDRSPDPFMMSYILGKEATLERIETAIRKFDV
jgi:glutamyl/glutaminyl-tRNA synthetase